MITIEEARELVLRECRPLPAEQVLLAESLGRALAQPVVAPHDVPPFANSAMDGFAVLAADTRAASPEAPVTLTLVETIAAGHIGRRTVELGQAAKIMTGAPLPSGADAVVQVEETSEENGMVSIRLAVESATNVRAAGEDLARGQVVLSPGDAVGPAEIGILASLGFAEVTVHRRPRVAILSTGTELVEVDQPLGPGQIRNSNSYTLEAQCRQLGLEPVRLGVATDDYDETFSLMRQGLEQSDVLITSGGVSVGEFDFVKDVQEELGVERKLWQVNMKPGKPLVFGVREEKLVFGVPGNPVAAMVSFELFIRPALLRLMGRRRVLRPVYRAVLREAVVNRHGRVHVVRVRAWWEGGRWLASSTGPQGSGILRSMVLANGLVFVPAESASLDAGSDVDLVLLKEDLVEPSGAGTASATRSV